MTDKGKEKVVISINGVFDHLTSEGVVAWYYCMDIDGMYIVRGTILDTDTNKEYTLGKQTIDTALIATYKEQGCGTLLILLASIKTDSETNKNYVETEELAELHNYIYWEKR